MAYPRHPNALEALPHPEFTDDDHALVARMKTDIEGLSDVWPVYSRTAMTPRGKPHVTIFNGAVKAENDPFDRVDTVMNACARSLITCIELRLIIGCVKKVVLWWRAEPALEWACDDPDLFLAEPPEIPTRPEWFIALRMRLCFEEI